MLQGCATGFNNILSPLHQVLPKTGEKKEQQGILLSYNCFFERLTSWSYPKEQHCFGLAIGTIRIQTDSSSTI